MPPRDLTLHRRGPVRQPYKRIHVLCEGSVTETEYLRAFVRWVPTDERTAILGELEGGVGVPKTIVCRCIDLKTKVERDARKAGYAGLDEVWAVFDVDAHDLSEALPLAKAHGIRCAISNPCIEVWGALHHEPQNRPCSRHEAQRALRDIVPDYHHEKNPIFSWGWCSSRVEDAVRNAVRGRLDRFTERSEFPNDVPSSNFDRLLGRFHRSLNELCTPTQFEWELG